MKEGFEKFVPSHESGFRKSGRRNGVASDLYFFPFSSFFPFSFCFRFCCFFQVPIFSFPSRGPLEKGCRTGHFLENSRDSRELPGYGKQRRTRPFSRDSREFKRDTQEIVLDSRDSSSERTPFVMTPFAGPEPSVAIFLRLRFSDAGEKSQRCFGPRKCSFSPQKALRLFLATKIASDCEYFCDFSGGKRSHRARNPEKFKVTKK